MARAYKFLIEADKSLVSGNTFNAGYENQTVNHLASLVKKVIGDDIKIKNIHSNDNRSYHISSKKIEKILGFKTEKTIEDAIIDLKNAFISKKLINTLEDEKYFNIKRMNNLELK
jgi:nucleoside-diphosphate-sugar epimerase